MPLTRIVDLTIDHLTVKGEDTYLHIDKHPALLPPRLADLLINAAATPSHQR